MFAYGEQLLGDLAVLMPSHQFLYHVRAQFYARYGGAQVMRYAGNEIPFHVVEFLQLVGHLVEFRRQHAHLVPAGHGDPVVKPAGAYYAGRLRHGLYGRYDQARYYQYPDAADRESQGEYYEKAGRGLAQGRIHLLVNELGGEIDPGRNRPAVGVYRVKRRFQYFGPGVAFGFPHT